MPLVEGHDSVRCRWTANLMTFSDKARLRAGDRPPLECMFKAEGGGEKVQRRLDDHLAARGHPPWVSATTSEKGSYRTNDVLAFLERHLPEFPQHRQWRIMLADDHGPHLAPHVKKMCWSRGYVFIAHGGGVTPIHQTVDTHLNQHVKREYMKREGAELLRQMRMGQCVPQLRDTEAIDVMVEVLSGLALHLAAADGYWETGFKANIWDAEQDFRIVKEAGHFWRKLGMREKVDSAAAEVREEVEAGRLRWCYKDIMNLVLPHPRHGKVDDVLANLGDDTALDAGDSMGVHIEREEREGGGSGSSEEDDEDWGAIEGLAAAESTPGPAAAEASASAVAGLVPLPGGVTAAQMQEAADSSDMCRVYDTLAAELRSWGDIAAASFMEKQRDKERRRARELGMEDEAVVRALIAQQDAQEAADRRAKRLRKETEEREAELCRVQGDMRKARKRLQAQQARLAEVEEAIDIRHTARRYALSELGQGRRSCGGQAGRTARLQVLVRMASLGSGLSPEQRADFDWFRNEWDAAGQHDFEAAWPETFATWIQGVVEEYLGGNASAFSEFVNRETRRRLAGTLALTLPLAAAATGTAA